MPTVGPADIRAQLQKFATQHPELKSGSAIPQNLVGAATAFVNAQLKGQLGTPVTADVVRGQLEQLVAAQADRGAAGLSALGGQSNGTVGAGLGQAGGLPKNRTTVPPNPAMFGAGDVATNGIAAAAKLKDPSVTQIYTEPSSRTSTTLRFDVEVNNGKELKPGEKWLFQIPPDLRGASIRSVILVHRKDAKYGASVDASGRDQQGAYDLVTARKSGTDQWVTWRDQYGDKKFAEPRPAHDPENENLHDWLESVGQVPVDLVAVAGKGVGENAIANVHKIEIEFFPAGTLESQQEEIFTAGTAFADAAKGQKTARYGGGQGSHLSADDLKTKGLYPNAVELGGYGGVKATSQNSYVDDRGSLHVKLPAGKVLGGLEVAVGDTQFDKSRPAEQQRNKDGHYGSLGWAKLNARVENKQSGTNSQFITNVNVPPSGVISGGPVENGYVTKPGDEIVIEARGSKAFVMGYRVQFMAPGGQP